MPEIALRLYDGVTALDAVGPYEVLARLPDAEVRFVGSTPGPKETDARLVLTADCALDDVPASAVIVVPRSGKVPFLDDAAVVEWSAARTRRRDGFRLHGLDPSVLTTRAPWRRRTPTSGGARPRFSPAE